MKSLHILGSLAILGAILLVGCGDKSSSKTEPLNLESFVAQGAEVACNALVQCSCTDTAGLADCKTAYGNVLGYQLGTLQAAYPGRKMDPTAAQKCLDDMKAELSDCNAPILKRVAGAPAVVTNSGPSVGYLSAMCDMDLLFPGVQAEGEPCRFTRECVADLSCDEQTYTCVPSAADGEACGSSTPGYLSCQADLQCYYQNPDYACEKVPAVGEECPHGYCVDGASCVDVEGTLKCVAPHALGESCSDGAGCIAGTFCDDLTMESTMKCIAALADGTSCVEDFQCLNGWCNGKGQCDGHPICSIFQTPG